MERYLAPVLILLVLTPLASAVPSEEERLATLAAKMLDLDELTGDYRMECGPGPETVNTLPSGQLQGPSYCLLTYGGTIVFGTYSDLSSENLVPAVLAVFGEPKYRATVETDACDHKGQGTEFERCDSDAIELQKGNGQTVRLYAYLYHDTTATETSYLLVSDKPISSLGQTFFGAIYDFFRGWWS